MSHFRYSPQFIGPVEIKESTGSTTVYRFETSSTAFKLKSGATTILTANLDLGDLLFGTKKVYHEGNPPPGGGFTGGTVANDTTFSGNVNIYKYSSLSLTHATWLPAIPTDPLFDFKNQSGDLMLTCTKNSSASKISGNAIEILNSMDSIRFAGGSFKVDYDSSSLATVEVYGYKGVKIGTGSAYSPVDITAGGLRLSDRDNPAVNNSTFIRDSTGLTLKHKQASTEINVFDYGVTAAQTFTLKQKVVITDLTDATGDKTGSFQVYGGMSVSKAAVFNDRVVLEVVPAQAAQAAGTVALYGRAVAGKVIPTFRDSSSLETQVQAALYNKTIVMVSPSSGTALTTIGTAVVNVGTLAHPTPTATSYGRVATFTTAATAAATAGTSMTDAFLNLGAAGGFLCSARLRFPDANYGTGATGARIFVGLTSNAMATEVGADNPTGSRIGFALSTNLSDSNFKITSKNGTTETRTNSGVAFVVGALYDFSLGAAPGGTQVAWRITNLTSGVTTEGIITATLPAAATLMRFGFQVSTLTTVARSVHFKKLYVETEF